MRKLQLGLCKEKQFKRGVFLSQLEGAFPRGLQKELTGLILCCERAGQFLYHELGILWL